MKEQAWKNKKRREKEKRKNEMIMNTVFQNKG